MTNKHEFHCGSTECEPCAQSVQGYVLALDELAESAQHKQDSCACRSCYELRVRRLRVRALPPCSCGCSP